MKNRKTIPYGISSYKTIRKEDCYYVDKTPYIPQIEEAGRFLFLIRPRRFGKSSFLTVLESYYDIARKKEFDFFFEGTCIGKNPTPERNSYLMLDFNFSRVSPDPGEVEKSFDGHARNRFFFFGEKYRGLLDDTYFKMMESHEGAHQKLEFLLDYVGSKGHRVYVLIDEYDNFTNTVLSAAGSEKYLELTHGSGFLRFFFNVLKSAGDMVDSGLGRMFVTGVSPVTMDDVTSGFNIGRNISILSEFNELLGFTGKDVEVMLDHYGISASNSERVLRLLREWYDGYRFSENGRTDLYNTDMVLYFMIHFLKTGKPPDNLIDQNVRIDYGKLRHLMVLNKCLNGNFDYLSEIVGNESTRPAKIAESFPVERLTKPSNFISLLFYFGLLSYSASGLLHIPNRTVKKLMYEYMREGFEDTNIFKLDFWRFGKLVRDMAYKGEWEPVFAFLGSEIEKQTSIRDYLNGEKAIQAFLLAYLNITDYYVTRSEEEMGKGFADLFLEPFSVKYPDIENVWLIELKYLSRTGFTEEKTNALLSDAKTQLKRYASDSRISGKTGCGSLKCLALVFSGWELKAAETISV